MTLRNSWPGPSGVTTTTDARIVLGGLLEDNSTGVVRTGVFPATLNAIVTARSDMNVDIAAFQGVANQFGGPVLLANDGTIQLPSALVSPVSGTNYYVVYVKQNEATAPGTDADNLPKAGQVLSTTSFAAARATLPTGALELATVQVPSGVSATNAVGVTITQTAQFTVTEGGVLPVRNGTELAAWTPADGSLAWQIDTTQVMLRTGSAWVQLAGGGAWTAYTPTWGGTSTSPTLGNSIISGAWTRVGSTITFRIYFKIGSTANGNSAGAFNFTLPFTANASATRTPVSVHLENSGVGFYTGVGMIEPGATQVTTIAFSVSAGAVWGSGSGFTVNSVIAVEGTYQV